MASSLGNHCNDLKLERLTMQFCVLNIEMNKFTACFRSGYNQHGMSIDWHSFGQPLVDENNIYIINDIQIKGSKCGLVIKMSISGDYSFIQHSDVCESPTNRTEVQFNIYIYIFISRLSGSRKGPRPTTRHQSAGWSQSRGPHWRSRGVSSSAATEHTGSAADAGRTFHSSR